MPSLPLAAFGCPPASARAAAVATTIEYCGVHVKRPSFRALRVYYAFIFAIKATVPMTLYVALPDGECRALSATHGNPSRQCRHPGQRSPSVGIAPTMTTWHDGQPQGGEG